MDKYKCKYCKTDCKYLSITEENQNKQKIKDNHFCYKFEIKLFHYLDHPNIHRCEECLEVDNE